MDAVLCGSMVFLLASVALALLVFCAAAPLLRAAGGLLGIVAGAAARLSARLNCRQATGRGSRGLRS